ncbi:MAG: 6-carboxytetrahydropterin synthase QueD [Phycisphaeraceae bacterium]|nr:MAG: 6-carboxytetrahydropterin synthase QueD [Phycisphaeraceae bacterium]
MFEITVEADFSAAHALTVAGIKEPVHGHNWHVTVTLVGDELDDDGLLCDFHTVEGTLHAIVEVFNNQNINDHAAFRENNPSAERVAEYIAGELDQRIAPTLAPHARLAAVTVTEAPRCTATYRPIAR